MKQLVFVILALISLNTFSQKIEFEKNSVFVNDKEYVQITKTNDRTYEIWNLKNNKKILVIKTIKRFNDLKKEYVFLPKVTFVELNKTWNFETKSLKNDFDIIQFIYNLKIVFPNGEVNKEMALNYYEYFKNLNKN